MSSRGLLRMAMVGGGAGSFIGPVHRMAAQLDGRIRLVAGAFSRSTQRSSDAARTYGIDPQRSYATYEELVALESRREDGADFVAIVTPNHLHLPVARAALEHGLHVISDKPATATLSEARELETVIRRAGRCYALTYTYSGYSLVREARELCAAGVIGEIRKVVVEYVQGWLSERVELDGQKQAAWRADPTQAGLGGCVADIGVHAFHLLEFVTGLKVVQLCAQLSTVLPGRALDDDCNVLLRLENGAPAVLHASQIAAGERNDLRLRVHGQKGSLVWAQENPNRLQLLWPDRAAEVIHAGSPTLSAAARRATRLPAGHPEGYIEAFANIYGDFADMLCADGPAALPPERSMLPGIEAGIRGMSFVESALANSRANGGWTRMDI